MFNKSFRAIVISVIFLAALSIGAGTAWAVPGVPPDYQGTVYIGGVQADAGLSVTASIGDWTTDYSASTDSSGTYWISINPPDGTSGTIYFYVNGVQANETASFSADGETHPLDLHIAALPAPTPTPTSTQTSSLTPTTTSTVTSTPTPTSSPTPEPISSNGSGSVGSSGGTVNTTDGTITISFPGGAFNTTTNISIHGGACTHGATADFVVGGTCFNVTPDGALGAAATICVNLSAHDFSIVTNTSTLRLGYWSNGSWMVPENATPPSGVTLCVQTTHLSEWAVIGAAPAATPTATAAVSPSVTPTATSTTGTSPTPTQTPMEEDEGGTNWALAGGIAGGVLLFAAIIIFINRSSGGGKKGSRPRRKPAQRHGTSDKDDGWK